MLKYNRVLHDLSCFYETSKIFFKTYMPDHKIDITYHFDIPTFLSIEFTHDVLNSNGFLLGVEIWKAKYILIEKNMNETYIDFERLKNRSFIFDIPRSYQIKFLRYNIDLYNPISIELVGAPPTEINYDRDSPIYINPRENLDLDETYLYEIVNSITNRITSIDSTLEYTGNPNIGIYGWQIVIRNFNKEKEIRLWE